MNPKGNPHNLMPPWKKGDPSPNPGGQARGKRISTAMTQILDMTPKELERFRRRKDLVGADLVALARYDKSLKAAGEYSTEIILDRTEGSVEKTINVKDDGILERMTPEKKKEALKIALENQESETKDAG